MIKNKIEQLRKEIKALEVKIWEEIKKHYPDFNSMWHSIGHWDCDKSPIGLCMYNYIEDKVHDDCIFCGHPEERK